MLALVLILAQLTPAFADDVDMYDEYPEVMAENCTISAHKIEDINLIAETAEIPITISNTCKNMIKVKLSMVSLNSSVLDVQEDVYSQIPDNSSVQVNIPVIAKANGDLKFTIAIVADQTLLENQEMDTSQWTITIHSSRDIGNAITVFFYLLVGFLILGGIYRTVKRIVTKKPLATDK